MQLRLLLFEIDMQQRKNYFFFSLACYYLFIYLFIFPFLKAQHTIRMKVKMSSVFYSGADTVMFGVKRKEKCASPAIDVQRLFTTAYT